MSGRTVSYRSTTPAADPLAELSAGTLDAALVPAQRATAYTGETEEARARSVLATRGMKAFATVTVGGVDYWPILDTSEFRPDDETLETAIDGVSDQISNGASIEGDPKLLADALLGRLGIG